MSSDYWRPSKRQLEVLAECSIARLDTARTAQLLGVSEEVFAAWTKRLAAAVAHGARIFERELVPSLPCLQSDGSSRSPSL
jgi:hypothetical protein